MKQILVVAPPGRLQEGLQVLLATLPESEVVVVAGTAGAARQARLLRPQLVIVAGRDAAGTLATVVEAYAPAHFLLLVEHSRQMVAAEAAGADVVLVEGTPAARLLAAVRALLADASPDTTEVSQ